jgi:hypothetical protein
VCYRRRYKIAININADLYNRRCKYPGHQPGRCRAEVLLLRFADVHDGYDRLGMVHEARGEDGQVSDCYRKASPFIRQHSDDYDNAFADVFVKLVANRDPPPAT